jgi:hypothetical protein
MVWFDDGVLKACRLYYYTGEFKPLQVCMNQAENSWYDVSMVRGDLW